MQKQRITLIVGVVLAIVVVFLIKIYLDQQRQISREEGLREAAKVQANQVSVIVAKEDIPKGVSIKPELLDTKIFPAQYVAPQSVTSLDRIGGMITIAPIPKGEQITLSKLTYPKQAGGLAEATPVGKRAITINVDNMASLAGMVKPGDYADLIVTLPVPSVTAEGKQAAQVATVPLLQNILVLAVGQEIGSTVPEGTEGRYSKEGVAQKKETPSLITIALSPQEANLVAFVQEQGKFRLILRSPADSQVQPLTPVSWDALFQHIMPPEAAAKPKIEETEPTEYVEIYRGLKKEKIPLSK